MRPTLSNTQLKVLAVVTMTIDHIGAYLLPELPVLRYVGRLAFPIFAYLVAEGCYHTSNKARYLGNLCAFGIVSQVVYWFGRQNLSQSVFTTLTLSVCTIFALQWWADGWQRGESGFLRGVLGLRIFAPLAMLAVDVVATTVLPTVLPLGFYVMYRLPGVLLPVAAYLPRLAKARSDLSQTELRTLSLAFFAFDLGILCATATAAYQWWSMLALVPLALYNGRRGTHAHKYFFYAYYPLHLAVIMVLAKMLGH